MEERVMRLPSTFYARQVPFQWKSCKTRRPSYDLSCKKDNRVAVVTQAPLTDGVSVSSILMCVLKFKVVLHCYDYVDILNYTRGLKQ
jgi:hypothetical protein